MDSSSAFQSQKAQLKDRFENLQQSLERVSKDFNNDMHRVGSKTYYANTNNNNSQVNLIGSSYGVSEQNKPPI